MNKLFIVIGLVVLIIGAVALGVGNESLGDAQHEIDECQSDWGKTRQLIDTDYRDHCDENYELRDSANGTLSLGAILLIVGIIIGAIGVFMKRPGPMMATPIPPPPPPAYGMAPPPPDLPAPSPHVAPAGFCVSCGTPIEGQFCKKCGRKH